MLEKLFLLRFTNPIEVAITASIGFEVVFPPVSKPSSIEPELEFKVD